MNVNDFDKKIIRIKDTDGKIFTGEASSISAKYVCNHRVGIVASNEPDIFDRVTAKRR